MPRTLNFFLQCEEIWKGFADTQYGEVRPTLGAETLKEEIRPLQCGRFSVLQYTEDEYPCYSRDVSKPIGRDAFQTTAMRKLGGGELKMLDKILLSERRGGGIDDMWKYIHLSDRHYTDTEEFQLTLEDILKRLSIERGCVTPMSLGVLATEMNQNLVANPGPTYKALGFLKKRESCALAWDIADHILVEAGRRPIVGYLRPRYALAGRTKCSEITKFETKQLEGMPFGRAVWMADQHEQVVAGRYVQPCLKYFHERMDVVCLGLNKFSEDPTKVAKSLERFNCFINGDFSQFDLHASPRLIRRAFDILRAMHAVDRDTNSVDDRIFNWLEDQFTYTHVVLPTGRVVVTTGGIPSGSGLTSLIGSLVNAVLWFEVLHKLEIKDYSLKVSGDDNYLGVNVEAPSPEGRIRKGKALLKLFQNEMDKFGMEISEKTKIGAFLYAAYAQPRVPKTILDGSSRVQDAFWRSESERLGRPLKFVDKYEILKDEPIGPAPGATHRWNYVFHLRAPFLSHYFKKDRSKSGGGYVMMVRPLAEVLENLVHPEHHVRTLDDHLSRVQCALVENMGNHHVVNHCMHYAYDAFTLRKMGVKKPKDLSQVQLHPLNSRRAWYRRVDTVVDVELEDPEFGEFWQEFLESARRAHSTIFGSSYISWMKVRAFRKGRALITGGLGLSSRPHATTYAFLRNNRKAYETLGPVGLCFYENPHIRERNFETFLYLLENGKFSMDGEMFLENQRWVTTLRLKLTDDSHSLYKG